jgi:imidazole glycerol-phosphate synthase subunit HisF
MMRRNTQKSGADKVSINEQGLQDPQFLNDAAKRFGSQCIVSSIDAKKTGNNKWEVYRHFGKEPTGKCPHQLAKEYQDRGVGEIIINSIDNDGAGKGYDLELVKRMVESVNIPVIALGGVGQWNHFDEMIEYSTPSAVAASNVFQYTENSIFEARKHLFNKGHNVRPPEIKTMIKK